MVDCFEWDRYVMREMEKKLLCAKDLGKYVFIQDCHGEASRFFQYKGRLVEFGEECQKIKHGKQTVEGAAEFLRQQIVQGMREHDHVCINLDKYEINFDDYATKMLASKCD